MAGKRTGEQSTPGDVDFCTLGMVILDDIEFGGSRPDVRNVLGGAASFAVIGARLVAGEQYAKSVSWIVDMGSDFPSEAVETINSWHTNCVFREDTGRLTTRAWNGYGENEKRDFKYLTPKLRLEPWMLSDAQVLSRSFHMVCSSSRCMSIVESVLERRQQLLLAQNGKESSTNVTQTRPIFVWEPVPDLCTPEEQENFLAASRFVDVVSPNELELGKMFGRAGWREENRDDRALVQKILDSGIGPNGRGFLVIRAGKDGSYSYSRSSGLWLPAYHQPSSSWNSPVVDPTGAGNAFLGALAQGMLSMEREAGQAIETTLKASVGWTRAVDSWGPDKRVATALICATVAAGVVVEQIGVPRISRSREGRELWNGTEFTERVRLYTERLHRTSQEGPRTLLPLNGVTR